MNNNTIDTHTACDQYLRRDIHTPDVLNESPKDVGCLLPQHLESELVNAMNTVSVLRPLCTEITTTGESALPIANGHGKAAWVPEGHPIPLVKAWTSLLALSGSTPILFGDFKQVYINNNGKRSIKRLDQLFSANDHIGFMLTI